MAKTFPLSYQIHIKLLSKYLYENQRIFASVPISGVLLIIKKRADNWVLLIRDLYSHDHDNFFLHNLSVEIERKEIEIERERE